MSETAQRDQTTEYPSHLPLLVLTLDEAAAVLRIGRTSLDALTHTTDPNTYLPTVPLTGRRRGVRIEAIREWLERNEDMAA